MFRYREDIDGLRSLAIVPILLFHAGVGFLRGGYVGVDVFFVISGYLITGVLLGDLERREFSIARFYQRRIARILPALFFMLAGVALLAGPTLVLAGEIGPFFKSLAAAAGFVSNIYFWSDLDYFARAAESRPLLHTWSLGVEEQFYIFFPLLLWLLSRYNRRVIALVLTGISVVSLGAGILTQMSFPSADFYLLPFRAWELLLGALIALGLFPTLGPRLQAGAAMAGVGMIVVSTLFMVEWLPFPSPMAIVPCMGTALVIAYGETTIVARVLSVRPLRWVGKISFSLYLWHWPIITFYRERTGNQLDWAETTALVVASFLLAAISYYLIEQPARRKLRETRPIQAVPVGVACVVMFVSSGLLLASQATRIWPSSPEVERMASYQDYRSMPTVADQDESLTCFVDDNSPGFNAAACLDVDPSRRNVLLFGDSHAEMYGGALRTRFPQVNWLQATHYGCPPVAGGWSNPGCIAIVDMVLEQVVPAGRIDAVVLADRWRPDLMAKLEATIAIFRSHGIEVTVIGPVPEYQGSLPVILARASQAGQAERVAHFLDTGVREIDAVVRRASVRAGARYYSVYDKLCPGDACITIAPDGGPMQFDYGHLTYSGAVSALGHFQRP